MRRINLENAQAARAGTMRDINRQIVLNYAREREPISRAEIARETARDRLDHRRSVKGRRTCRRDRRGGIDGGRKPTLLRLRAAGGRAVGVDVTPTHTTAATSDSSRRRREDSAYCVFATSRY